MYWYELAQNPLAITELYTITPSLQSVHLLSIVMTQLSRLDVTTDLPSLPDKVPPRWKLKDFTTIHLRLTFFAPTSFQMNGWSSDNLVDLHFEKTDDQKLFFQIRSAQCHLQTFAQGMRITVIKQ